METSIMELIIKLIVTIIFGVITSVVIPWLQASIDQNKLDKLQQYAEYAVRYAEQIYKPENYREKKAYVLDYMKEKCEEIAPDLTDEDIEILVEGVVNLVKH